MRRSPHPARSPRFHWLLSWLAMVATTPCPHAQLLPPRLEFDGIDRIDGWARLSSSFSLDTLLTLEASEDFADWRAIGSLHDALHEFPDPGSLDLDRRYYRLRAIPRGPDDDWKNQILFPDDPFLSPPAFEGVRWVKFAVLLADPTRVYFQESSAFPFHYEFATTRLAPFQGMSREAFDAVSLHRANQQAVLGAVLYPPGTSFVEYGVQFVGLDPYTPEEIARWFQLVKATVHAANGAGVYYMPAFEQSEVARTRADELEALGVSVDSLERWISSNHIYAPGWTLGRLKYFPAAEIAGAFADGRLQAGDILLTDGVPAETPMVAGIISLTPSTPNSHTAILAKSFGIPFLYLPDAGDRAAVQQLVGHQIILRAIADFRGGLVKVVDVEGTLTPELESELRALKVPRPIEFPPKQSFGAISAPTDGLAPDDIRYFGGKAANYSLLRRAIPDHSPPAIGLSFDLWDAFLEQTIPGGQSLRAEIGARLAPFTTYPPDMQALQSALAGIRSLITESADFTAAQREAVIDALAPFEPGRRIRFRSSTNVEDSEHFTGAGLYDSYSGCLLDDLDADNIGPSHCEPDEADERGVFHALRRVYASFYNNNAFLERLRHGVDETKVGMGVLVHHSFPDEEELANGVATLRFRYGSQFVNMLGDLVTQLGAESVTNPDGTSIPEVVDGSHFGSFKGVTLKQRSSRVPLGAHVMTWEADYEAFLDLFKLVGDSFRQFHPSKGLFHLDFEYKKDINLGLVVKQVREIPDSDTSQSTVTFVINEPTEWSVFQGEAADVFSNHRLKSLWSLETHNLRLSEANLAEGIYTNGTFQYVDGSTLRTLAGPLDSWPNASNSPEGSLNSWTTGTGPDRRSWQLETTLTTSVAGSTPPVFTQDDFPKTLSVTYAVPMPTVARDDPPTTTTSEMVRLERRPRLHPGALLQQRTVTKPNGVTIDISFYWPKPPGFAAGYTAPLVSWVGTRITGLTTDPINLTSYYSQTYRPGHHNFTEEFVFEPGLDPGVPTVARGELEAANVRLIHVSRGFETDVVHLLGFDGVFRRL